MADKIPLKAKYDAGEPVGIGEFESGDTIPVAYLPDASESAEGVVELATDSEARTGTATNKVITPANLTAVLGTDVADLAFVEDFVNEAIENTESHINGIIEYYELTRIKPDGLFLEDMTNKAIENLETHIRGLVEYYELTRLKPDGLFLEDMINKAIENSEVELRDLINNFNISGSVSDDAFGSGWNGVTNVSPSQNSLYDLLVGAANLRFFMKADGSTPEWAVGIKVGTITRNMATVSGDQSYTGVGFKPSNVIFISAIAAAGASVGFDDASTHGLIAISATTPVYGNSAHCILVSDGSNYCQGVVKTLDSDGFTITYAKGASASGTLSIHYIAFR